MPEPMPEHAEEKERSPTGESRERKDDKRNNSRRRRPRLGLLARLRRRLRCRPRVYRIVRARLTTLFEIIPIDAIDCFFTREDARYVELVIFDNNCPPEAIPRSYRRLYVEALERCSSGCTGFNNKQPYPKFYDTVRCMKTQTVLILARDVTRRKPPREG